MPKKAHGMKRISEGCRRFLDLWCAGVKETSVLVKECQCSERQIWRWVALLRDGMLDRHMGVEHRVKPIRPGLARGSEEQKERKAPKDDPEAMAPPVHAKRLRDQANKRGNARKEGKHDDAGYGKAPTLEELIKLIDEAYGPDFVPDPGVGWDPMAIARQAARDPRVRVADRLKAVDLCERRRQFDLLHGTSKGKVSWPDVVLADIPVAERSRLFGLLAEQMQYARAPFLAAPETTREQEAVFFSIGVQVHPEDAARVLAELGPARESALGVARELAAARMAPAASIVPVDPADYLELPE